MVQQPPDDKLTPAVIAKAPDSVEPQPDSGLSISSSHPIWILIRDLQVENENLKADNDRLSAESDIGIVKARLLKPLANRIFWFLAVYTGLVFAVIGLHGFRVWEFTMPDSVLAVLAGTSLVSIVGLAGTMVSGLFLAK